MSVQSLLLLGFPVMILYIIIIVHRRATRRAHLIYVLRSTRSRNGSSTFLPIHDCAEHFYHYMIMHNIFTNKWLCRTFLPIHDSAEHFTNTWFCRTFLQIHDSAEHLAPNSKCKLSEDIQIFFWNNNRNGAYLWS